MSVRGVPAGPVRTHLRRLVRAGATAQWIAEQSGVSERTVRNTLAGQRPSLNRASAELLLAVSGEPPASRRRTDPARTITLLRELEDRHWPPSVVAAVAKVSLSTLMPSNLSTGVSDQTAAAVERAHRLLAGREGPATRAYPALAERLQGLGVSDRQVAAGAGVAAATVWRIRTGQPVTRSAAVRVSAWVWQQRADQRPAAA